jgi:hypothetical protein
MPGPVRCCDYCFRHLCAGDQNSMLRYLLILRAPDAEDIAKFKAARVLYMSICHEQVWSKEEESTRRNSDAAAKYPALHEAIRQIGGYDALWGCIIPNLKESVPPGLRSLSGRMISRFVPGQCMLTAGLRAFFGRVCRSCADNTGHVSHNSFRTDLKPLVVLQNYLPHHGH